MALTEKDLLLRAKISKYVNVALTIISMIVVIIAAFLLATKNISGVVAGLIIPGALMVYLLMGVLSNRYEDRRPVMIIYIVLLSICAVAFFIDLIYYNVVS